MTDTLAVHLGREGTQSVSVADEFETTGSFELAIHNHGSPAHVHLHVDDVLAQAVSIGATNHYVEGETVRYVEVVTRESFGTITGSLEVVTSYGAESDSVRVTVTEPPTVAVDETLTEPNREEPDRALLDRESAPLAGVAITAVAVFVALAATIDEGAALAIGLVAVAAGVGAGLYLLSSR